MHNECLLCVVFTSVKISVLLPSLFMSSILWFKTSNWLIANVKPTSVIMSLQCWPHCCAAQQTKVSKLLYDEWTLKHKRCDVFDRRVCTYYKVLIKTVGSILTPEILAHGCATYWWRLAQHPDSFKSWINLWLYSRGVQTQRSVLVGETWSWVWVTDPSVW